MPVPSVKVTAQYPALGYVTFELNRDLYQPQTGETVEATLWQAQVGPDYRLTISLPATDTEFWQPIGAQYVVREYIGKYPERVWLLSVPSALTTLDYTTLVTPPQPTSVTCTALPNGMLVKWGAPSDGDYLHSDVYIGTGVGEPPLGVGWLRVAAGIATPATVVWDAAVYSPLSYTEVKVIHYSRYGQPSVPSVGVAISTKAIDTSDLQDGAITAGKIGTGAVTEIKIGAGAVTEAKIGALAVTEAKLGALAVSEGKLAVGAVTADKIGALAVTEAKIAAGAVTNTKIGALAVDSGNLAAGAVTAGKIGTGGVSAAGQFAAGVVDTTALGALAVTEAKLGALAVTAGKIGAGAVDGSKLASTLDLVDKIVNMSGTSKIVSESGSPRQAFKDEDGTEFARLGTGGRVSLGTAQFNIFAYDGGVSISATQGLNLSGTTYTKIAPFIDLGEVAPPATPSAGRVRIYPGSGILVWMDDAGVEHQVMDRSTISHGAAFPAAASWTNKAFYQTTLKRWGYSDGTRWLSEEFSIPFAQYQGTVPLSATTEYLAWSPPQAYPVLFTRFSASFYTGGNTNGTTNRWDIVLRSLTAALGFNTVGTLVTPDNGWTHITDKVQADFTNNPTVATDILHQIQIVKTGTPNAIYPIIGALGRLVLG